MTLDAFPIAKEDEHRFRYDGGDAAMFNAELSDLSKVMQRRCANSHIAPELLDPYVFWQFISGMLGEYTMNGASSGGDWRLFPSLIRMAERLEADPILPGLRDCQAFLETLTGEQKDQYDSIMKIRGEEATTERLHDLYDRQFMAALNHEYEPETYKIVREGYGYTLRQDLAQWISDEMPKNILPGRDHVEAIWEQAHEQAIETEERYLREWTAYYVGEEVADMLAAVGRRYGGEMPSSWQHQIQNKAVVRRFKDSDGNVIARIEFADALMLMDDATRTEIARVATKHPYRNEESPPMWSISEKPQFTIDWETNAVRPSGVIARRTKPITYSE